MKTTDNLRGLDAWVEFDGTSRRVTIVTHIRGSIWLVEGRALPKRFARWAGRIRRTTVTRDKMTLIEDRTDPA